MGQDSVWSSVGHEPATAQGDHAPRVSARQIDIVGDGDDRHTRLSVEPGEDSVKVQLVLHVQIDRGLVEQKYSRSLGQGAGQNHPLTLSAAEFVERLSDKVARIREPHGVGGNSTLFGRVEEDATAVGRPAHENYLFHRERKDHMGLLRDKSDLPCEFNGLPEADRPSQELGSAREIAQKAGGHLQERRFAGSVRTDDCCEVSRQDIQRHSLQDGLVFRVGKGKVLKLICHETVIRVESAP